MTSATICGLFMRAIRIGSVTRRCFCGGSVSLLLALGSACTGDSTGSGADDSPPGPDSSNVVAVYRGGVVHRAEFDRFEEKKTPKAQDIQIGEVEETDWRLSTIAEIVVRKVLEAEVAAVDPDPALQVAVQRSSNGILVAAMIDELGWERLAVTREECREYYDSHPDQYIDPKIARADHLFLRAEDAVLSPTERNAVRERLEGIRREVLSGADFTELIRQHSESDDASRGGVMTLKADADVFPAFAEAVWALEVGELSEVIDIPTGFQLVKMREIIPPVHREFETVVEFVRRKVLEEKKREARDDFVREAGERSGLERYYERLSDPLLADDEVLFVVGDTRFTFRDLCTELTPSLRPHLYSAHFPRIHEFLDEVVLNTLLLSEAERLQLSQRSEIAAQIEAATREIRYQRGLDARLQAKVSKVPDEELREFFRQNEQRFQTLRTQDLDVILVKPEEDEPFWATLRRAEDLVKRIRGGEDFSDLARAHSAHYSAANGGRLEGLTDAALVGMVPGRPAFRAELKKLAVGEVSDPMVAECYDTKALRYTRTGVLIARVVNDYPPEQKTFEEVRDAVLGNYLRVNFQRIEAEVRREILKNAAIEIDYENLPAI
jgi:peptidyl-prolyl cis-trans isomerase C